MELKNLHISLKPLTVIPKPNLEGFTLKSHQIFKFPLKILTPVVLLEPLIRQRNFFLAAVRNSPDERKTPFVFLLFDNQLRFQVTERNNDVINYVIVLFPNNINFYG